MRTELLRFNSAVERDPLPLLCRNINPHSRLENGRYPIRIRQILGSTTRRQGFPVEYE
jgi:hypothetical protein